MSIRGVSFVVVFLFGFWLGGFVVFCFRCFVFWFNYTPSAPFCIITARDPHTAN